MVTSCIHGNNWMLVSDRAQGLENLPPTTYYTVDSKMYRSLGLASNTTYQPRVRSLQGNLRLRSLHQGEVWVFPVMTEWTKLISYLLYANSIKTLEVIFNIPLWAYWVIQGHVHWIKTNLMMWSIPQDTLPLTMRQFLSLLRQDRGRIEPLWKNS